MKVQKHCGPGRNGRPASAGPPGGRSPRPECPRIIENPRGVRHTQSAPTLAQWATQCPIRPFRRQTSPRISPHHEKGQRDGSSLLSPGQFPVRTIHLRPRLYRTFKILNFWSIESSKRFRRKGTPPNGLVLLRNVFSPRSVDREGWLLYAAGSRSAFEMAASARPWSDGLTLRGRLPGTRRRPCDWVVRGAGQAPVRHTFGSIYNT